MGYYEVVPPAGNDQTNQYIAQLSSLTLRCDETEKSKVIEFYMQLGFAESPSPAGSSGTWLRLDLLKAGLPGSSDSSAPFAVHNTGDSELLLQIESVKDLVNKGSPVTFTFCVPDLQAFQNFIEKRGIKFTFTESFLSGTDPLGNLVVFSNRCSPFSSRAATMIPSENSTQTPVDFKPKKRIAVLTSGGDSQGMNCAVRSVVRAAIAHQCEAYTIQEGYQGLVDGGSKIRKTSWGDVRRFISVSGTIIGTARCMDFKERIGRLKGAENLIKNGIDALVVIGGDGSLTGADLFRSEWSGYISQLLDEGRISPEQANKYAHLTIVGLVGSIDNDMAGTDFTIGAVSSLHRICESVDNVTSTALSHRRAFVVEVMGRHCGWLALMAAVCTGADFVFIPEQPYDFEEWKENMCSAIKAHRGQGRRATIVIVSEGAIDRDLKPIKSQTVAEVIEKECDLITRVTNLGHVQRGGVPAAQDRILGAIQGIQAIDVILNSTPSSESKLIATQNNQSKPVGLMQAVKKTKEIAHLVETKRFDDAMKLRDPYFRSLLDAYSHAEYRPAKKTDSESLRVGIIHIGAPSGGMNAATRTLARLAINDGHVPIAIHNGIRGLIAGEFSELSWIQVGNWTTRGGSELGTNRELPDVDYGMCAYQLQKQKISSLLVIGGFEAFRAVHQLVGQREAHPAFCIPIAYIPATISNNVPGADYSLGCDTSLNAITEACDRIIQSAASSHSRVFVVEVQGGHSGFLATMGGLTVGASRVYIPEEGITLKDLTMDVEHMKAKFRADAHRDDSVNVGRVVLVSDAASKTYSTEMISSIFAEEGEPLFDSRTAVLGHIQQGGPTSPVDRIHAVLFAHRAYFWLMKQCQSALQKDGKSPQIYTKEPSSAVVIGTQEGLVTFTPILDLESNTDWKHRRPRRTWWHRCCSYNRLLAHYDVAFHA